MAVPKVELLLACSGSYKGDIPAHTHHHHLQAEYIDTVGLLASVERVYLECSVFVPYIPVA